MNFGGLKNALKSSYLSNDKAEKELQKFGYTLDKDLSGQRAKVYTDANGKPTIVYRGTNNLKDWVTNLSIPLGLAHTTNRVKHSKMVAKQVEAKYGQPANAVGHSLGGYLAEVSGANGNVVTYNKASVGTPKRNAHQIDIRTSRDVVSMLTPKNTNDITIRSAAIGTKVPVKPPFLLKDLLTEHKTDALGREQGDRVVFV